MSEQDGARIVGLDVGGAHLKVAIVTGGKPAAAHQILCPLWLGFDRLDAALDEARTWTDSANTIAVTMTGELSDLFEDRAAGVAALVTRLENAFGDKAKYWLGQRGFGSSSDAIANPTDAGSTNFLATAQAISKRIPNALLIDMGSTTCDIVPIVEGAPCPLGLTDASRLQSLELVYTGLTRTAVMGVTNRAVFDTAETALVREYLATMADVRRILGELPDGVDQHATADGRGKSVEESIARLARMFGRDHAEGTLETWTDAARSIADAQELSIVEGIKTVVARHGALVDCEIISAGIGADVIARVAANLKHPCRSFGELVAAPQDARFAVTSAAPAASVALLAAG